jgi:hypothetical protein
MHNPQPQSTRPVGEWPFWLFVIGLLALIAAKAMLEQAV